jgi:SAM-dependent methyltransferase
MTRFSLLVCPKDHAQLREDENALVCTKCAARYEIRNGIPVFTPPEFAARFVEAQAAEAAHHEDAWTKLHVGSLSWVKSLADYREWLESFYRVGFYAFGFPSSHFQNRTVLEIGSGPFGMLACLPHGAGVAVDPLMPDFVPYMQQHWAPSPTRIAALGETLPVPSSAFDDAVAINCLDHTLEPEKIIREISRTLKPGGFFFLMNNVKSAAGVAIANVGEKFGIKRLTEVFHPHAFTQARLRRECEAAGLQVIRDHVSSTSLTPEENARFSLKTKMKMRVINEVQLWILAQKPLAPNS